ncbi:MAG: DNA polymerase I [Planctomycetota bacterium]|nr:DNA polymerase I [Planctomycetota bacterium]
MEERLFLIDGTALAYRSYFGFIHNPLKNSRGENTSAVFGFANSLLQLIEEEKPDHLAVAFDGPDPTFRHEQYEDYKATREKMPEDLVSQLDWIRELVEGLRIPFIIAPGYEADDVIGTLARQARERGVLCYVVSEDKDFMQLVGDRVRMMGFRRGIRVEMGPAEVEAKFGVPPDKVVEVLALMGDASDNVPGVPGIGQKGAIRLIQKYGSVEEVLAKAEEVTPKRAREGLLSSPELARLSLDLVRIDTQVPLDVQWDDLSLGEPDRDALTRLFSDLEFETLLGRVTSVQEKDVHDYRIVRTAAELGRLLSDLREAGEFVIDLETTSLDQISARIVGVSFAYKEREAWYVPLNDPALAEEMGGGEGILQAIRPLLVDPSVKKGGQNIKYDLHVLLNHGIEMDGVAFDTMIASFLVDPGSRQHNLDSISLRVLNFKKIPTSDVIGSGAEQKTMLEVPIETVGRYACEDADITLRLYKHFLPKVREQGMELLFRDIEVPLIQVLMRMEREGIGLDQERLVRLSKDLAQRIDRAAARIFELSGEEFNINSTRQLGQILFERMKIQDAPGAPRVRRTKTGYSTAARVLEEFSEHPIVETILEYRMLSKLKSTYLDALPRAIHGETNRIHTSFSQAVATTGRLSSSDPNLQNIPIRSDAGKEIRAAFVPGAAGQLFLSADYSQIELRILAHMAADEGLISAFEADEDVHRRSAATIFGLEPEEVSDEVRGRAKAVNYGIIYGMGPRRLAQETGTSLAEAKEFIRSYFAKYPGIERYLEEQRRMAREEGFVATLMGRRRYLPDILSPNRAIQQFAERAAVNTPIQGTAADIIKVAMIQIDRDLRERKMASRMILQVHDELVFQMPEEEADALEALVRERMEGCVKLAVPLKVEMGRGKNWLEAHP